MANIILDRGDFHKYAGPALNLRDENFGGCALAFAIDAGEEALALRLLKHPAMRFAVAKQVRGGLGQDNLPNLRNGMHRGITEELSSTGNSETSESLAGPGESNSEAKCAKSSLLDGLSNEDFDDYGALGVQENSFCD